MLLTACAQHALAQIEADHVRAGGLEQGPGHAGRSAGNVEHETARVVNAGSVICSTIAVRQRRFWPIERISASRS